MLRMKGSLEHRPATGEGTSPGRVRLMLFNEDARPDKDQPGTGWEGKRSPQEPFPFRQLCRHAYGM
jgi:hypothetical protein